MKLVYWSVQGAQLWLLWEIARHVHWSVAVFLVVVGLLQRNVERERQAAWAALWQRVDALAKDVRDLRRTVADVTDGWDKLRKGRARWDESRRTPRP